MKHTGQIAKGSNRNVIGERSRKPQILEAASYNLDFFELQIALDLAQECGLLRIGLNQLDSQLRAHNLER
jgi:hypothetical protein